MFYIKGKGKFSGEATLSNVFSRPSEKCSTLKEKYFAPSSSPLINSFVRSAIFVSESCD